MIKTMGILVLLIAALYYSYSQQWLGKRKYKMLEELCDLLRWIQKNIECFVKPLDEISHEYTSPLLASYDFYKKWQTIDLLTAFEELPYLTDDVRKVLQQYGKSAGRGYKEEELRLCRYTCEQLNELRSKQAKDLHTKKRMYQTLPFLLVLSIILLLY